MDLTLRSITSSRAVSELNLLEVTYGTKVKELEIGLLDQSRNPTLINFLRTRDPGRYASARQLLLDEMKERQFEFLVIVNRQGEVVVGGFANKTGHVFDPDSVSSAVIGHPEMRITEVREYKVGDTYTHETVHKVVRHYPSQIVRSGLLPYAVFRNEGAPVLRERKSKFSPITVDHMADTRVTGLVRYVSTPIFAGNTSGKAATYESLLGVLVAGDVVNGKVPIVEQVTESFDTGYSGVWYDLGANASLADMGGSAAGGSGTGRYQQAISYIGLIQNQVRTALAGFSFSSVEYLSEVAVATTQPVLRRLDILKQTYTMAGKRLPDSPAMLVRGTSDEGRQATLQVSFLTAGGLIALCIGLDAVLLASTLRAFSRPLKKIRDSLHAGKNVEEGSKAVIRFDDLPPERGFYVRAVFSNLAVGAAVVGLLFLQSFQISETLLQMGSSEINVMGHLYAAKPEEMRLALNAQASHSRVVDALVAWEAAVPYGPNQNRNISLSTLAPLKKMLTSHMHEAQLEIGVLVDRHGRIIADGNGGGSLAFRQNAYFDPANVVSDIIDSPQQIIMASVFPNDDYLAEEPRVYYESIVTPDGRTLISGLDPASSLEPALVRWVGVPVFLPSTTAAAKAACVEETHADAVLLYGDSLNGKLGLPGRMQNVMGDGYSAVYLFDSVTQSFSLASALLSSQEVMESDVELPAAGKALLKQSIASDTGSALGVITLAGKRAPAADYTLSIRSVKSRLVVDSFGQRNEPAPVAAFIVRGVLSEAQGEVRTSLTTLYVVTGSGLLLTIFVRFVLAWASYRPVKSLVSSLVRYGFLDEEVDNLGNRISALSGTSSGTTSSGSGTTSSSGSTDSSGSESGSHQHSSHASGSSKLGKCLFHTIRFFQFRNARHLKWTFLTLVLLMVVASLAQVVLLGSVDQLATASAGGEGGGSSSVSTLEDEVEMLELVSLGGGFLVELFHERALTALMLHNGWDAAAGAYDGAVATTAQYEHTNRAQGALNKALAAVNLDAHSSRWVEQVKQAKRAMNGLRNHRKQVARRAFTTVQQSSAFTTNLIHTVLGMLYGAARAVNKVEPYRMAFSYLTLLAVEETQEVAETLLESAVVQSAFSSHAHYRGMASAMHQSYVFHHAVFDKIAPSQAVAQADALTSGPSAKLVKAWETAAQAYPDQLLPPVFPSVYHLEGNVTRFRAAAAALLQSLRPQLVQVMQEERAKEEASTRLLMQQALVFVGFALYLGQLFMSTRKIKQKHMKRPQLKYVKRHKTLQRKQRRRLQREETESLGLGKAPRHRLLRWLPRCKAPLWLETMAWGEMASDAVRQCRWFYRITARLQFTIIVCASVALLVFSVGSALFTMVSDLNRMAVLQQQLQFSAAASQLANNMQVERGMSVGLVQSGYSLFRTKLAAQRAVTDRSVTALQAQLPSTRELVKSVTERGEVTPITLDALSQLEQGIAALSAHRAWLTAGMPLTMNSTEILTAVTVAAAAAGAPAPPAAPTASAPFTAAVNTVLGLIASLPHLAHDGYMFQLAQSYASIAQRKEASGLARASMSAVLSDGTFTKPTFISMVRIDSQMTAFDTILNASLPGPVLREYESRVSSKAALDVNRWWNEAMLYPPTFSPPQFPDSSASWFANSTLRIEGERSAELHVQQLLLRDTSRITTRILTAMALLLGPQCVMMLSLFAAMRLFFQNWKRRISRHRIQKPLTQSGHLKRESAAGRGSHESHQPVVGGGGTVYTHDAPPLIEGKADEEAGYAAGKEDEDAPLIAGNGRFNAGAGGTGTGSVASHKKAPTFGSRLTDGQRSRPGAASSNSGGDGAKKGSGGARVSPQVAPSGLNITSLPIADVDHSATVPPSGRTPVLPGLSKSPSPLTPQQHPVYQPSAASPKHDEQQQKQQQQQTDLGLPLAGLSLDSAAVAALDAATDVDAAAAGFRLASAGSQRSSFVPPSGGATPLAPISPPAKHSAAARTALFTPAPGDTAAFFGQSQAGVPPPSGVELQ